MTLCGEIDFSLLVSVATMLLYINMYVSCLQGQMEYERHDDVMKVESALLGFRQKGWKCTFFHRESFATFSRNVIEQ